MTSGQDHHNPYELGAFPILLAHRDPQERNELQLLLESMGFDVFLTDTGRGIRRFVRYECMFPLVIMEEGLVPGNPYAYVRQMREDGFFSKRMPFVFLSYSRDKGESKRVRQVVPHTAILRSPLTRQRIRRAMLKACRAGSGSGRSLETVGV